MSLPIHHPDVEEIELATVLRALSDPVRLEIVRLAAEHAHLPCKAFLEQVPKSTASHHWRVLRESGVIRQHREGTQKLNSLRRDELDRRFPGLLDAVLHAAEASTLPAS